jgi:hypothetical protein
VLDDVDRWLDGIELLGKPVGKGVLRCGAAVGARSTEPGEGDGERVAREELLQRPPDRRGLREAMDEDDGDGETLSPPVRELDAAEDVVSGPRG